jgi:N-acylneuraminate cytidylyltransferase/CMP-N,N'-diacetyllegionaminic acid synthase
MTRPSTLGLVPARGGSKSIPLKNLKLLGGRPLIAWALEAIAASGVVDRTLVTTDDERIAEAARAAGADVPFLRPPELAGDDAPTAAAVEHALRWLEEHEGAQPEQIAATLELMLERGADSAITVVEVPRNQHPFHVRVRDGNGLLEFADAEAHYAHPRRQDDPPRWAFGNLYWFRRAAFLASGRIEVGRRVGLPVDAPTALDLNDEDDWAIAEAIAARL